MKKTFYGLFVCCIMVYAMNSNLYAQNYAVEFDGNDYIDLPNELFTNNLNSGTALTLEFMFKGTVLQSPLRFQSDATTYVIAGYGTGDPVFAISSDGGTASGVTIAASADLEDDNWHHVAMSWAKNGNMVTYLDGVMQNTRAAADVNLPVIDSGGRLGSYGSSEYLTGSLDEVRIWNVERSQIQIQSTMNTTLTGSESGLVAYYKMSNGSGTTLSDQTAHGYNSTGWSGATWITLPFSGGYGTSGNPWQIVNLTELGTLSGNSVYWDECFLQTANIDAAATASWNSGTGWSPIGYNWDHAFYGTYDGNNYSISGLTINRNSSYQAFIGAARDNCTIQNLTILNASISMTGDSNSRAGVLVGEFQGNEVSNCHASGTVNGDGDRVGGLIGFNGQTVSNCSFSGTISDDGDGSNYYGGLIGYNSGSIQDSYTSVSMSGNWYTGGLVGSNEGGTINRCYSSTSSENSVFGSYYVGGLVGKISNSGLITESYSTATVVGYVNIAGGLVGDNNGSTINNCYSRGSVTRSQDNNSDFGSFIGKNEYSTVVTYCYSTGAVIYQNTNDPTDKGFVGNYSATGCSNNIFDSETSRQNGGSGATAKTTSEMKTTSTYTGESWDFSGTTGGTDYYWERDDTKNGGYPYLWWQTFPRSLVFTDGSAYTSSPTVGETNQPLGRFSLVSDATGAILDGVWITLNGTRTGATNFKLWQSSDDSFDSGSDSLIGSVVTDDPGNGGDIWFLNLSRAIGTVDEYFFITCDLAADATGSIRGEIGGNKDIFTEFGTINSEISNAYLSGDDVPLPVTLSSFTGAW
ncbi:MAG TPA: LamG domain-containing protein, partial [Candidatus Cloacimonadota bacterium]|nr:LamG domain-containing protein [Candidatus Cloacimonadota bacterium]